jgi:hypothetical protein
MSNNILIGAEGVDGANFLACCLTMSDEVYFNNCSLNEKVEYFFNGMTHIEKRNTLPIWSDVSMLFQNCYHLRSKMTLTANQSKTTYESVRSTLNNKTLINKVSMPSFWPLDILKSKNPEDPIVKLFESKYFIGLINPDLFISLRTLLDNSDDSEFNLNLLNVEEFNSLSEEIKESIKNNYQSGVERLFEFNSDIPTFDKWNMANMECHIDYMNMRMNTEKMNNDQMKDLYKKYNDLLKDKITHQWDCNWFLSEEETFENIKFLYSEMNLGECNQKLIREMYKVWIRRIDYIKKSHVKAFINTDDES